jgi:hypothetical protein
MKEQNQHDNEAVENKDGKISLQEAIKRKMAEKKQAQSNANSSFHNQKSGNQTMKSQQTKKPNNQRRRTGV